MKKKTSCDSNVDFCFYMLHHVKHLHLQLSCGTKMKLWRSPLLVLRELLKYWVWVRVERGMAEEREWRRWGWQRNRRTDSHRHNSGMCILFYGDQGDVKCRKLTKGYNMNSRHSFFFFFPVEEILVSVIPLGNWQPHSGVLGARQSERRLPSWPRLTSSAFLRTHFYSHLRRFFFPNKIITKSLNWLEALQIKLLFLLESQGR